MGLDDAIDELLFKSSRGVTADGKKDPRVVRLSNYLWVFDGPHDSSGRKRTVREVLSINRLEIRRMRNIGRKSIELLELILQDAGYEPDWITPSLKTCPHCGGAL